MSNPLDGKIVPEPLRDVPLGCKRGKWSQMPDVRQPNQTDMDFFAWLLPVKPHRGNVHGQIIDVHDAREEQAPVPMKIRRFIEIRRRTSDFIQPSLPSDLIVGGTTMLPHDRSRLRLTERKTVAAYLTPEKLHRERRKMSRKQKSGFEPSWVLASLLTSDWASFTPNEQRSAAIKVRGVIIGMIQSIADARAFSGETDAYRVSDKTRFVRPITNAILERLNLDPYMSQKFLDQLYRELLGACPFSKNNWLLSCAGDGSLFLKSKARQQIPRSSRNDVQAVRMKMGQRDFGKE